MASLRKRYQSNGADQDGPPVQTAPSAGAELPPPVADKQPAGQPVENAVEQAAQNALKARLAEMENAEGLQREALSQQQRRTARFQRRQNIIEDHCVARFVFGER